MSGGWNERAGITVQQIIEFQGVQDKVYMVLIVKTLDSLWFARRVNNINTTISHHSIQATSLREVAKKLQLTRRQKGMYSCYEPHLLISIVQVYSNIQCNFISKGIYTFPPIFLNFLRFCECDLPNSNF